jgi:hypothetical protein
MGCDADPEFVPLSDELVRAAVAEITLPARDLQEEFRKAPHAANARFAGRILEVEGEVFSLGRNAAGSDYVALKGGGKGTLPIQCLVQEPEPWRSITPETRVALKGQCTRVAPGQIPLLVRAVLTRAAEDAALRLTAEELTAAFLDDRAAAVERFGQKWARVTGRFAGIDTVNGAFFIDGRGNAQVLCVLTDSAAAQQLDPSLHGRGVTVLGRVENGDRRVVMLKSCMLPYPASEPTQPHAQNGTQLKSQ